MTELECELLEQIKVHAQEVAIVTMERDSLLRLLTEATEWADNQLGPYDTHVEWFVEARRMLKNSGGGDD